VTNTWLDIKTFPWAITCGAPGICPGRSLAYMPAIGWPSHHVITRSCYLLADPLRHGARLLLVDGPGWAL